MVPAEPVEEELPAWENDPKNLDELLAQYVIESKCAASVPGGTLYLTNSMTRDNNAVDIAPDQRYKLFFVPCICIVNIFGL